MCSSPQLPRIVRDGVRHEIQALDILLESAHDGCHRLVFGAAVANKSEEADEVGGAVFEAEGIGEHSRRIGFREVVNRRRDGMLPKCTS